MSFFTFLRCFGRKYKFLRRVAHLSRGGCELSFRLARLLFVSAHLAKKEILVLHCADGSDVAGYFSEFTAILGLLEHYEKWKRLYAGVRVDFGNKGLYYDSAFGDNYWEYFFQPINFGSAQHTITRIIRPRQHDEFAFRAEIMTRKRGHEIIDRYVRLKPQMQNKIDTYVSRYFSDSHVIGIHYRGTDKYQEAPRIPYEMALTAIREQIERINTGQYVLFLATDEQRFLDYLLERYPDRLNFLEIFRSVDCKPIHERSGNNYKKGEEAVLDCLLLSRCHVLIRTASNLGWCAALFNPAMPQILLRA